VLTLRPASIDDARRLFAWADEPHTRAMSGRDAPLDWTRHVRWLEDVLVDPSRHLYVAEQADGRAIGQCRVDVEPVETGPAPDAPDRIGRVSIAVAPEHRGRGCATAILARVVERAEAELGVHALRAVVLNDNAASLRLFARAGFARTRAVLHHGRPATELVRESPARPGRRAG